MRSYRMRVGPTADESVLVRDSKGQADPEEKAM